jgi:putative ABC transport system ATP-binding protein
VVAVSDDAGPNIIELSEVTKSYRVGEVSVHALRGVSLVVRQGQFVAVTGASGSGKTTLLSILGCLDRPTTGSYRLVGEEMSHLDETARALLRGRRIGVVFQAYNLLPHSTAYENVELPLVYAGITARQRAGVVLDALAQVGLTDRARHRPSQLSGGEQQRVGIARALVVAPTVLLADEPTGNLDSKSAEDVLAILDQVHRQGTTIVMITHSYDVAAHASRVLLMTDGLLVSDELRGQTLASAPR